MTSRTTTKNGWHQATVLFCVLAVRLHGTGTVSSVVLEYIIAQMRTDRKHLPATATGAGYRKGNEEGNSAARHRAQQWACGTRGLQPSPPRVATTDSVLPREVLAAAKIACEGRVWEQDMWRLRGCQGGTRSSAHDRRQPGNGAADQDQGPPARARWNARAGKRRL